jgi:hypothetical protein
MGGLRDDDGPLEQEHRRSLTVHKAAHYVCLAYFAEAYQHANKLALAPIYQRKHRRRVAGMRARNQSRPLRFYCGAQISNIIGD